MSVALLVALMGGSGFMVLGLVRIPLRFEERLAAAVVTALVLDTFGCFLLSLGSGLSPVTILGAPLLVAGLAGLASWRTGGVVEPWRLAWAGLVARHRQHRVASLVIVIVVVAVAALALFSRAMTYQGGDLVTGYWLPDWSQHLITASSFNVAHQLPPANPIFSGTRLDYPFLPDLTSAMLMRLGLEPGLSLALPQALLCSVIALLIICLAERLGARRAAGVLAVAICFLGGGIGFLGAFEDACARGGYSVEQCSLGHALGHPTEAAGLTAASLSNLPAVVSAQPRSYDGLPSLQPVGATPVMDNQQWYTPLFGWWMPQRSMVFGFATVLVVLTLLLSAMAWTTPCRVGLSLAGGLAGLLPLIHVHSLFALVIVATCLALSRRRRIWLLPAAVAAVVGAPRMFQLASAPHGTAQLANQYPWLEPGWLSQAIDSSSQPRTFDAGTLLGAVGNVLRLPFIPRFWSFWVANLGVAVPLCLLVVVIAAVSRLALRSRGSVDLAQSHEPVSRSSSSAGRLRSRLAAALPSPLLRLCLSCMPIFLIANVVVFQSWDWDNTKLFAYWYLGAALLIGALAVHLWRGVWRRVLAVVLAGSVLATGALGVLRLVPFHPSCRTGVSDTGCYAAAITGPYTVVTANDLRMAGAVVDATAPDAVFLTSNRFDDPIPVITGRPIVMGYDGWLWSYGIDYSERKQDVATAFSGCGSTALQQCQRVLDILRRYSVSYVEVDASATQPSVDAGWWSSQGLPVIARSDHIVVYDVRRT